jgi:ABC-type transporter Mla subunit MlaD
MEQKALYFRVGVVILAGIAMIAGLVLWVGADVFRSGGRKFETYFSESVQGLEVGAAVRFRGVPVGRVTEIGMAAAEYPVPVATRVLGSDAFTLVVVRFEVFTERFVQHADTEIARLVQGGLRVRMASQGITGVLYLEADFLDSRRFPAIAVPWEPRHPVIPSAPSTLSQFTSAAERLVARLEQAQLPETVESANRLIGALTETLMSGEAYRLLVEGADALAQIRTTLARLDPAAETALADAERSLATLRQMLESRETRETLRHLEAAASRLPQAVGAIEGAARRLDTVMADADRDIGPMLRELRLAAENLRIITENMRQYPSQVLFGAPPPRELAPPAQAPAPRGLPGAVR